MAHSHTAHLKQPTAADLICRVSLNMLIQTTKAHHTSAREEWLISTKLLLLHFPGDKLTMGRQVSFRRDYGNGAIQVYLPVIIEGEDVLVNHPGQPVVFRDLQSMGAHFYDVTVWLK